MNTGAAAVDQFWEDRALHYREVLSIALSFRFSKRDCSYLISRIFVFDIDFVIDVSLSRSLTSSTQELVRRPILPFWDWKLVGGYSVNSLRAILNRSLLCFSIASTWFWIWLSMLSKLQSIFEALKMGRKGGYYAVRTGRKTGIFQTWYMCQIFFQLRIIPFSSHFLRESVSCCCLLV